MQNQQHTIDHAFSDTDLLESALFYAQQGWYVFPLRPASKVPATSTGHHEATLDLDQIKRWWAENPQYNIGIAVKPSGLVVLDVDVSNGKLGKESLDIIAEHLDETLTAQTPSGGYHLVYKGESRRLIGFEPGLDLLGDGYFVAAPSKNINGVCYAWIQDHDIAPMPAYLSSVGKKRTQAQQELKARSPIKEGGRNQAAFALAARLIDSGFGDEATYLAVSQENKERFDPPLDEAEIASVVVSARRHVDVKVDRAKEAEVYAALGVGVEFGDAASEYPEQDIEDLFDRPAPEMRVYPSYDEQLNRLIGDGFISRTITVVAAPPGSGKSGWALSHAMGLAKETPKLYISTELESSEVASRAAANRLMEPWVNVERGKHVDRQRAREALVGYRLKVIGAERIPNDPLAIITLITEAIDRITEQYGEPPVVFVDYLQDMARGSEDSRKVVGELSRALLQLAQRRNCAIVAVSAVSRAYYGSAKMDAYRASDDPTIYQAAIKESGDVDYATATQIYLELDNEVVEAEMGGSYRLVRIAVSKARRAQVGFAGGRFYGASGRWKEDKTAALELLAKAQGAKSQKKSKPQEDIEAVKRMLLDRLSKQKKFDSKISWIRSKAFKQSEVEYSNEAKTIAADELIANDLVTLAGKYVLWKDGS